MKYSIVCSAILLAAFVFGPVGATPETGVRAVAPLTPVAAPASAAVTAPSAAEELEVLQSMPLADDGVDAEFEPEMGNCVACDAGKSKDSCKGKSSCNGSASDCRKRGCRVKGTTSKCSDSC